MTYCRKNIFINAFLCSLLSTKNEYILGFDATNALIATPSVSSFILPMTNLLQLSQYFDLVE